MPASACTTATLNAGNSDISSSLRPKAHACINSQCVSSTGHNATSLHDGRRRHPDDFPSNSPSASVTDLQSVPGWQFECGTAISLLPVVGSRCSELLHDKPACSPVPDGAATGSRLSTPWNALSTSTHSLDLSSTFDVHHKEFHAMIPLHPPIPLGPITPVKSRGNKTFTGIPPTEGCLSDLSSPTWSDHDGGRCPPSIPHVDAQWPQATASAKCPPSLPGTLHPSPRPSCFPNIAIPTPNSPAIPTVNLHSTDLAAALRSSPDGLASNDAKPEVQATPPLPVPSPCTGAKPKQRRDRNYGRPGKYRGVRYRGKGRWSAEIKVREARRWLGIFQSAEEAARAFDKAAFEIRGSRATLNFSVAGPQQHQVIIDEQQQQQVMKDEQQQHQVIKDEQQQQQQQVIKDEQQQQQQQQVIKDEQQQQQVIKDAQQQQQVIKDEQQQQQVIKDGQQRHQQQVIKGEQQQHSKSNDEIASGAIPHLPTLPEKSATVDMAAVAADSNPDRTPAVAVVAATATVTASQPSSEENRRIRSVRRSRSSSIEMKCEETCVASEGDGNNVSEEDTRQHCNKTISLRSLYRDAASTITGTGLMPRTPVKSDKKQQRKRQTRSILQHQDQLRQEHRQLPEHLPQYLHSSSLTRSDVTEAMDPHTHNCTPYTPLQSPKQHSASTCHSLPLPCPAAHVPLTPRQGSARMAGHHLAAQVRVDATSPACTAGADIISGYTRTSQPEKRVCRRQLSPPSPLAAAAQLSTSSPPPVTACSQACSPLRSAAKVSGSVIPQFGPPSVLQTELGHGPAVGVPAAQCYEAPDAENTSTASCYTVVGVPLEDEHSILQQHQQVKEQQEPQQQQENHDQHRNPGAFPLMHNRFHQQPSQVHLDSTHASPPTPISVPPPTPRLHPQLPSLHFPLPLIPLLSTSNNHGSGIISSPSCLLPLSPSTCHALRARVSVSATTATPATSTACADAATPTVSAPFPAYPSSLPSLPPSPTAGRPSASPQPRPHAPLPLAFPASALVSTAPAATATAAVLPCSSRVDDTRNSKANTHETNTAVTAVCGTRPALPLPRTALPDDVAPSNSHTRMDASVADPGVFFKCGPHDVHLASTSLACRDDDTSSATVTLANASFRSTAGEAGDNPAPSAPVEEQSCSIPFNELQSSLWGFAGYHESENWDALADISELLNDPEPPSAASAAAAAAASDNDHNNFKRVKSCQILALEDTSTLPSVVHTWFPSESATVGGQQAVSRNNVFDDCICAIEHGEGKPCRATVWCPKSWCKTASLPLSASLRR